MKQTALNIVEKAFLLKTDKGGNPYILHLKRVAQNSKDYFNSTKYDSVTDCHLETIGLLHDLIEDCEEWNIKHIESIFNNHLITSTVETLTKKKNVGYENYIEQISKNKLAVAVKLADLKDNMDLSRLPEITQKDLDRVKKYHKSYIYLLGFIND